MTDMNNSNDDQSDFAIIHVRPGLQGKEHPVGTIAIDLGALDLGLLVVGYAIQHSSLDAWDGARGRAIAVGRAARRRDTCLVSKIEPSTMRRELLIAALDLVKANSDTLNLSRGFRRAVSDTLARLLEAKTVADLKRAPVETQKRHVLPALVDIPLYEVTVRD